MILKVLQIMLLKVSTKYDIKMQAWGLKAYLPCYGVNNLAQFLKSHFDLYRLVYVGKV